MEKILLKGKSGRKTKSNCYLTHISCMNVIFDKFFIDLATPKRNKDRVKNKI